MSQTAIVDTDTGEIVEENALVPAPVHDRDLVPSGDRYDGAACVDISQEQAAKLALVLPDDEHDILPTGEVYVSQVRYRRILNETFGPGHWALVPRGQWVQQGNTLCREFALIVNGRFISEAIGEQDYFPNNPRMSYATAAESVKSNALMRCCKDLGIASECWDRRFTERFKAEHCVRVWTKGPRDEKPKAQWRRKDARPLAYEQTQVEVEAGAIGSAGMIGSAQNRDSVPPQARQSSASNFISDAQRKRFYAIYKKAGHADGAVKQWLSETYGIEHGNEIPRSKYEEICSRMESSEPLNDADVSDDREPGDD